jgi:dienelactone hydrolase
MKNTRIYLLSLLFLFSACQNKIKDQDSFEVKGCNKEMKGMKESISFPSLDSLLITAELYCAGEDAEVLLLCHQANYSRGEYKETAEKLFELGYNIMIIDQRSGGEVNSIKNITHKRAKAKGLPAEYVDAEQDIVAAVNFAADFYGKKITLMGSSYSAGLALKIAAENENVKRVIAFSPGEYFGETLKIAPILKKLHKEVFVTSSRKEAEEVRKLFDLIPAEKKIQFIPEGEGVHGSKALWEKQDDHQEYWDALLSFLGK